MPFVYRRYGTTVEITEYEKTPKKIRVFTSRNRRTVYTARRRDNIRRTRKICVRRVLSALAVFGCPLLITLTFAGDASDASYANDALRRFQVRLQARFARAQSLFIPELSPRGRIHFHGLLFNVPLRYGDSLAGGKRISFGDERKERLLASLWREGYVDAAKTDGSPKLANYISKYITKGGGEVMFAAMRMLRISHGFPREEVVRGEWAEMAGRVLARNKTPTREWSGYHIFLGNLSKKYYD